MKEIEHFKEPILMALALKDNPWKIFKDIQILGKDLAGIIIVGWREGDASDKPSLYRGVCKLSWHEFGNAEQEAPRIYHNLATFIKKFKEQLNGISGGSHPLEYSRCIVKVGLMFWKHPDAYLKPLENYLLTSGFRFPGCPTQ